MQTVSDYLKMSLAKIIFSLFMVTLGSFIYSVAINSFVIPNHFGNGGLQE